MEQIFLTAWQKQSLWLWLLLPLSWLFRSVSGINRWLFKIGLKKTYYAKVPVIVIGNITVGGSGKTPLIIALVGYLQAKNINVGVISRGYGGDTSRMPQLVSLASKPSEVGDEPCLIVQSTQVPMAVSPNRGQAIELLLQKFPHIQLILADDGLQHHALDRDENWIVVDAERGFGNKQLLPVGFLREPISRLGEAHTTVIYHQSDWSTDCQNNANQCVPKLYMRLIERPIQPLFPTLSNTNSLLASNQLEVIAMTGIGYPQRFFNSLSKLNFCIIPKPLNDHHDFNMEDFANLPNLPIVVTTKDAVKIRGLLQDQMQSTVLERSNKAESLAKRIWVLPVVAELSEGVYDKLDQQLNELISTIHR